MNRAQKFAVLAHLGVLAATASAATFGPGPGGLIPDNDPDGFTSAINIPASSATIASFESVTIVFGNPNHSWAGDLHAELRSPAGTVIHLMSRVGSTPQNLFGDDSDLGGTYVFAAATTPASIAAAAAAVGPRERIPAGTYARSTNPIPGGAPSGQVFTDFSALVGGIMSGNWRLFVRDTVEGDAGGVVSWSIQMTPSLVVNNALDGSPAPTGSLRDVLAEANAIGGAGVRFAPNLAGTITLSAGALPISSSVAIRGPGAHRLAISGNNASRVFLISGTPTVEISDIAIQNGRSAGGTGNSGGAISAPNGAQLTMDRCTVRDSSVTATTSAQGGAIAMTDFGGELRLTDCTFHGNTTSANTVALGAAVYCNGVPATITNCTFANNTGSAGAAAFGAAVYAGADATLRSCTITANVTSGVGTSIVHAADGLITLENTIIAGNQGSQTSASLGSFASGGHNIIGDNSSGFVDGQNGDRIGIDPRLLSLADYGGPTPTCALRPDSPAIDAGGTTAAVDQRGLARGNDGDCNGVSGADIGAFEYNAGRGLNFDGASTFAAPATSSAWSLTSGFTVECWITADSFADPTSTTRFVSTRASSGAGWGFGQIGGKLLFSTFGRRDFTTTNVVLTPRVRTHVAVVFDNAFDARFYVNGQPIQTVTDTMPAGASTIFAIGRNPLGIDRQSFDGVMQEVRTWNVVRTDAEIAANYDRYLERPEAGLLAVWPLDDGVGNIAREVVAQRDATINPTIIWMGVDCPTCQSDLNGDFAVNLIDLAHLLSHFGMAGATYADGDIDGDLTVGIADLALLLTEFGASCP